MVWISVVLVIAVGLFFLRDNIAKFINNAATQIAGEESDGRNEYGFYFDKMYYCSTNSSVPYGYIFKEDGQVQMVNLNTGESQMSWPTNFSYSNNKATSNYGTFNFSSDGKTAYNGPNEIWVLKE